MQRYLSGIGVRVPAVVGWSQEQGYLVLEDLGNEMLIDRLETAGGVVRESLYRTAIDTLVALQVSASQDPDPSCLAFGRRFDAGLYRRELDHFLEWGLPEPLPPAERTKVDRHFDALSHRLAADASGPLVFTHRDFHARNLMVLPDGALAVIDFQDALLGLGVYDLVSLLRDSYLELDWPTVTRLCAYYRRRLWQQGGPELAEGPFTELFDLVTIQRKLKDAARFVFLDQVRGNPDYRPYGGRALGYVRQALHRRPELADLQACFSQVLPELT